MKKILFFVLFFCLIGKFSIVDAKSVPLFDNCGTGDKYKSYVWFSDLESDLSRIGVSIVGDDIDWNKFYVSDMCYSSSRNQVIINVPYMDVMDKSKICIDDTTSSICKTTINVFSYDTSVGKLVKARRDSNSIYEGMTKKYIKNKVQLFAWNEFSLGYQSSDITIRLSDFGKRIGDYIIMTSGYGDALCGSTYKREYFYKTNFIKAISLTRSCYNEETGKMTETTTYFGK